MNFNIQATLKDINQHYLQTLSMLIKKRWHNLLSYMVLALLIYSTILLGYNFQSGVQVSFFDTSNSFGGFLIALGYTLLIFKILFLMFLLFAYKKYKPVLGVKNEELPTCTVVIPAYNEGEQVYKTLLSLSRSDYPKNKIQLIAIDDGSVDDTWEWMLKAKSSLKDKLQILKQPDNQGKRDALYRAFKETDSQVVVTVDSDSIVEKNTIRNIVSPIARNKNCGAVAGNVKVMNINKGLIPKMLNVSFAFSFEFIRSAQSFFGLVLCTPGALSAYRKTAINNCLEEWMSQTFLGKRTQIGEDRAMTNMILKQGYSVKFQSNANVITEIPVTYQKLRKMFTRWERSNVRENIMMTKFAFSNFRVDSKWAARLLLINQWLKIIMAYPALILMIVLLGSKPLLFLSITFSSILAFASIPALFYFNKTRRINEALLSYTYSVFYAFSLFWLTPYAIATAGKNKWLTRGK